MQMQIWIRIHLITFMRMRIRILPINLMRIHADPDPKHCLLCTKLKVLCSRYFIGGFETNRESTNGMWMFIC
jgi:hypothetical protein